MLRAAQIPLVDTIAAASAVVYSTLNHLRGDATASSDHVASCVARVSVIYVHNTTRTRSPRKCTESLLTGLNAPDICPGLPSHEKHHHRYLPNPIAYLTKMVTYNPKSRPSHNPNNPNYKF